MEEETLVCKNLNCPSRTSTKPFIATKPSGLAKHYDTHQICQDHYYRTLKAKNEPSPRYKVRQPIKDDELSDDDLDFGRDTSLAMKCRDDDEVSDDDSLHTFTPSVCDFCIGTDSDSDMDSDMDSYSNDNMDVDINEEDGGEDTDEDGDDDEDSYEGDDDDDDETMDANENAGIDNREEANEGVQPDSKAAAERVRLQDILSKEDFMALELLEIFKQNTNERKKYKDVMEWSQQIAKMGTDYNPQRFDMNQNMDFLCKNLRKCGVSIPNPRVSKVDMQGKIGRKGVNIPTEVVHFDFNQQLLSLLDDEKLMQPENLVIDHDDPFGEPPQRQPGEPFECHHAQRYAQIRE